MLAAAYLVVRDVLEAAGWVLYIKYFEGYGQTA